MSPSNSKWNSRYRKKEYAYGKEPSDYLKTRLEELQPGKILFPADGEGRNSVFAAKLGWQTTAFDLSIEGKKKATRLAEEYGVHIDYRIGNLQELGFTENQFDAIALIYAHLPAEQRPEFHKLLTYYLKPGGYIIFEAFGKNHLAYRQKDYKVGGPADYETLFSTDEIRNNFPDFEYLELGEYEIELNDGVYHVGTGSVIRFFGKKYQEQGL